MNRFTSDHGGNLVYSAWLVADSDGGLKMTRGEPDSGRGEVAVYLSITVPKTLFKRPLLQAQITVPPQAGVSERDAIKAVVQAVEGVAFSVDVKAAPQ